MATKPHRITRPGQITHPVSATRYVRRGGEICRPGAAGRPWRVLQGSIRLDHVVDDEHALAGLAVAGDIIGLETLLDNRYRYQASALVSCQLEPWYPDTAEDPAQASLQWLIASQARTVDMLALRIGRAHERICRLFTMLGHMPVELPRLRDIAEITGLVKETVSRTITELHAQGLIRQDKGARQVRVGRYLSHDAIMYA